MYNTFGLVVQDINQTSFMGQNVSITAKDGLHIDTGDLRDPLEISADNFTAVIELPTDFFEKISERESTCNNISQRLSYSIFLTDILFQSQGQSERNVGSVIVAVRLKCAKNASLQYPVKFYTTFRVIDQVS